MEIVSSYWKDKWRKSANNFTKTTSKHMIIMLMEDRHILISEILVVIRYIHCTSEILRMLCRNKPRYWWALIGQYPFIILEYLTNQYLCWLVKIIDMDIIRKGLKQSPLRIMWQGNPDITKWVARGITFIIFVSNTSFIDKKV